VTLHVLAFVYAAILGLIVGSFLNVVIHRVPRQISVLRPRSRCGWCGAAVAVRDNIPILSFLLLRGCCRACGAPISARYPAVELATGTAFVACVARFGPRPDAAVAALFCALLISLALIDLEHYLLPDSLTLGGIVAGLALQPLFTEVGWVAALLGTALGAGILILIMNLWFWVRAEEGMGLGDVNMLAMIGAFLGWQGMLLALFVATLSGTAVGLALVATRRGGFRSRLPFGVFLAIGGFVSLFWGRQLIERYLGLL
jgi:leader peptidase (prepilin peptidase)/N-methyltransferase